MKVLDITNITSTVNKYKGLSKPSLFIVNITPPQSLVNEGIVQDLKFFASTANLPGINFNTEDYRPKGYGMAEPKPTNISIDDIAINFLMDNKGSVENFFHKWSQKTFNFDHTLSRQTSQGTPNEMFAYPSDIWATIDITRYDQGGEEVQTYSLNKAFIKAIGTVQLGWEINDSLMFLPVTFACKTFSTKATAANDVKYNTALDTLNNERAQSIVDTPARLTDQSLLDNIRQQFIS